MAKFYGKIGYVKTVETKPGVWTDKKEEREYFGDLTRNAINVQSNSNLNNDIKVNNTISIVADPFAFQNFNFIKYVEWMGVNWKVNSIDVQYPRLILSIGEEYNG